jgi:hypothetical protein
MNTKGITILVIVLLVLSGLGIYISKQKGAPAPITNGSDQTPTTTPIDTPVSPTTPGGTNTGGNGAVNPGGNVGGDGMVFCTMDALICPDGSGVGRSGPSCQFSACPNKPSFTGTLTQQKTGFLLQIPAPSGLPEDASTYNIPLTLKISNALAELVGQKVKVVGKFTSGNNLQVESLTEVNLDTADTIEVGVGQTKTLKGISITLNSVVQDNRCPVDVQCIEAGAITAGVTFTSGSNTKTFNMPSDEVPQQFAGYSISIENVKPSRVAAREPDPKSYKVTFKVAK